MLCADAAEVPDTKQAALHPQFDAHMNPAIDRRDDKVLLVNRIVHALLLILVLPAAFRLFMYPEQTEVYFAWALKPRMAAMFQGSFYFTVLFTFSYVALASKWHRAAVIMWATLPVISLLGLVTLLNLDKFNGPIGAFRLWFFVYICLPPAVAALLFLNRRRDPWQPEAVDAVLPSSIRAFSAGLAVAFLLVGMSLLIAPEQLIPIWPWQMKPLAARVLGSVLIAPVAVHAYAVIDRRWTSLRKVTEAAFIWNTCIVISVIRCWDEFDPSKPLTWAAIAALAIEFAFTIWAYTTMEKRMRDQRVTA